MCPREWVVLDTAWTLPLAVCCIGPLLVVDGVAGEVVAVHAVDAMVKSWVLVWAVSKELPRP